MRSQGAGGVREVRCCGGTPVGRGTNVVWVWQEGVVSWTRLMKVGKNEWLVYETGNEDARCKMRSRDVSTCGSAVELATHNKVWLLGNVSPKIAY